MEVNINLRWLSRHRNGLNSQFYRCWAKTQRSNCEWSAAWTLKRDWQQIYGTLFVWRVRTTLNGDKLKGPNWTHSRSHYGSKWAPSWSPGRDGDREVALEEGLCCGALQVQVWHKATPLLFFCVFTRPPLFRPSLAALARRGCFPQFLSADPSTNWELSKEAPVQDLRWTRDSETPWTRQGSRLRPWGEGALMMPSFHCVLWVLMKSVEN